MKRGYDRTQRIADLIHKTLAQMLLQEMSDERFKFVTVTGVTVTKDLAHAKIFVSVFSEDEAEIKKIIQSLNRASKALRFNLAHEVKLRVVPELKFVFDSSTAHGFHISHLIDKADKR